MPGSVAQDDSEPMHARGGCEHNPPRHRHAAWTQGDLFPPSADTATVRVVKAKPPSERSGRVGGAETDGEGTGTDHAGFGSPEQTRGRRVDDDSFPGRGSVTGQVSHTDDDAVGTVAEAGPAVVPSLPPEAKPPLDRPFLGRHANRPARPRSNPNRHRDGLRDRNR